LEQTQTAVETQLDFCPKRNGLLPIKFWLVVG